MNELETLAERLGQTLLNRGEWLATAESCTGGWVAQTITAIAGSSAWFDRGFVTYSNAAKVDMLGVPEALLAEFGAVSEAVAAAMAEGALAHSTADLAVSTTGIAGPGGSEFKPEGRVCFGLAVKGKAAVVETVEFGALGRDRVRKAARDHALELLLRAMA